VRRDVVEIGDPALASGNVGSGVKVGGKVVRVSVGRDREGCLVVPRHDGGEVRAAGSAGCVEPSKPSG